MLAYIVVGKLGAAHGINGWLKAWPVNRESANFLGYSPLYINQQQQWIVAAIEGYKQQGRCYLLKLAGIENPEIARTLVGKELAVTRSQLPPLAANEYYWADLIGCSVYNHNDLALGQVIYCIDTGANDVLVVKNECGREHAVPYLPGQVIINVDIVQRIIKVAWEPLF